jgi:osmotically-inducible protein OsmY
MTDEDIARRVAEELFRDPRIDDEGVAVSAVDGMVLLRGTVGSFHQKREATKAAERVRGVVDVDNQIDVEILTHERREDADLRGDVLEALMLDSQVPMTVNARVADGCVVLSGDVQWQYQREEAERVAGNVPGVRAVVNEILRGDSVEIRDDVERRIRKAFLTTARLDAEHLGVAVADGTITLTGKVQSAREHDEAVAAAWAIAGVRSVDDRLTITS